MRMCLSTAEVRRILRRGIDDVAQSKIIGGLGLEERLTLRYQGSVKIGEYRLDGWSCALPMYLFRCGEHGYQVSYPNGYDVLLICPMCRWGRRGKVDAPVGMETFVEDPLIV